jgi:hypothetical protein
VPTHQPPNPLGRGLSDATGHCTAPGPQQTLMPSRARAKPPFRPVFRPPVRRCAGTCSDPLAEILLPAVSEFVPVFARLVEASHPAAPSESAASIGRPHGSSLALSSGCPCRTGARSRGLLAPRGASQSKCHPGDCSTSCRSSRSASALRAPPRWLERFWVRLRRPHSAGPGHPDLPSGSSSRSRSVTRGGRRTVSLVPSSRH